MAVIFITHDLGGRIRILRSRAGDVCRADRRSGGHPHVCSHSPRHPYTRALQRSIPALQPKGAELYTIPGHAARSVEAVAGLSRFRPDVNSRLSAAGPKFLPAAGNADAFARVSCGLKPARFNTEVLLPMLAPLLQLTDVKTHFPFRRVGVQATTSARSKPSMASRCPLRAEKCSGWSANPAAASRRSREPSCSCCPQPPARSCWAEKTSPKARRPRCASSSRSSDDFPGSVRVAESAHDGVRNAGGAAATYIASARLSRRCTRVRD